MWIKKLSKEELLDLIDSLNPKIKKIVKKTRTIKTGMIWSKKLNSRSLNHMKKIAAIEAPNFEEFLAEFLTKQRQ
ncbi:hypothetical protein RCO48_14970 [Peribacillus frigoritolerans]|nr:hypothetical protein [Peribacillus frigoritolerans]